MHSTRQASVTRILLVLVYLQLVSCCSILTTPKSRRMVDNKSVPKNFSWLRQGKIAALAFPANKQDFPFLVEQGIGYLVTLSQELKPNLEDVAPMNWVDISVPDFSSFSMQQVQDFIKVCEKAQLEKTAVAVHCRAGIGRTVTSGSG